MSHINLLHASCADQNVDAVVNAANSMPNTYKLYGTDSSAAEIEAEVNKLKENACQIVTYHYSDYCSDVPMWTDAVGFVQSKPCLHMTYDEAVAYLQNKVAELSK